MEVIFMLIGFSLLVALIFLGLFFWAVRSGQFDDAHTPSIRILFDDNNPDPEKDTSQTHNKAKD